jgi:hypothetical protein
MMSALRFPLAVIIIWSTFSLIPLWYVLILGVGLWLAYAVLGKGEAP